MTSTNASKKRAFMYEQVVWHIIDSLPIYVLESRPNSSKSLYKRLELNYENTMVISTNTLGAKKKTQRFTFTLQMNLQ
jgi:hypothetical protein